MEKINFKKNLFSNFFLKRYYMYSLVIHGGAGDLTKSAIKKINVETNKIDLEKEYKNALEECCKIGETYIKEKGMCN